MILWWFPERIIYVIFWYLDLIFSILDIQFPLDFNQDITVLKKVTP